MKIRVILTQWYQVLPILRQLQKLMALPLILALSGLQGEPN